MGLFVGADSSLSILLSIYKKKKNFELLQKKNEKIFLCRTFFFLRQSLSYFFMFEAKVDKEISQRKVIFIQLLASTTKNHDIFKICFGQ